MPLSPSLTLKARERVGRSCRLRVNGDVIAVCRTKTLLINNPVVDVTSDKDEGNRRLLEESTETSVGISLEGIYSTSLNDQINPLGESVIESVVLDYGDMTIAGTFKKLSYSETKLHNDAIKFTAQYTSTRAVIKS